MEAVQRPPVVTRQQAVSVDLAERLEAFRRVCQSKGVTVTQVFGSSLTDPEAVFEWKFGPVARSAS